MREPIEPSQDDCCNSGCNPCIFDVFENQLKLFNNFKANGSDLRDYVDNGISQMDYTEFTVIETVKISDTIKKIKFKNLGNWNKKVSWQPGAHFLIKFVSSLKSFTKPYTPIKLTSDAANADFDFFIVVKKYINGLVSSYLFNLIKGDKTLWRGPYGSYKTSGSHSRIILIAQGVGIAPLISIIDSILANEEDDTKLFLLYCCNNIESILFREDLYIFKSYWNFLYKIYLSNCVQDCIFKYEEPIFKRRLTFNDLLELEPFSEDVILICGSTIFMEEYKLFLLNKNVTMENIILF